MIHRWRLSMVLVLAAGCAVGARAAEGIPDVRPMSGMADEATFNYYREGNYLGTSSFRWDAGGAFDSSTVMSTKEGNVSASTRIEVDDAGLWTRITVRQEDRTFVIERKGGEAVIRTGDETKSVPLAPDSVVAEDMSPALMRLAIAGYDDERGGRQTVPVFFVPMMMVRGSLQLVESFEAEITGKTRKLRRFRFIMPPIYGVEVVVDEDDRVCTVRYPVQNGNFVRLGYETLEPALIDSSSDDAGEEASPAPPTDEPAASDEQPRS